MILDLWNAEAFQSYAKPLEKLEKSFNAAGHPIIFHAFVDPLGNKMIRVMGGRASQKIICIEADSPAAAVKDVAKGVRI